MNKNKKKVIIFILIWVLLVCTVGSFMAFTVLKHNLQLTAKNLDLVFDQIISGKDDFSIKREASDVAFKTGLAFYIKTENFVWQSRNGYDYALFINNNSERTWFHVQDQKAGYHLKKGKYSALFIIDLFDNRTAVIYITALFFLCAAPIILFYFMLKNKFPYSNNEIFWLKENQLPVSQMGSSSAEPVNQLSQDIIFGKTAGYDDKIQRSNELKENDSISENRQEQEYSQINRLLSDLVRVKDHLLIDVNQKLKAPLSRIKLAADFLDGEVSQEIQKDAILMQKIIEDVFRTFRTAYNSDALKIENIDLLYFFNGLRQKQRIDRSMLLLKIGSEHSIKADRRLFTILIGNLLDNAFFHAKDSGQPVTVLCDTDNGITAITIRNHGPAIPVDDIPHIFDPFYQVKNVSKTEEAKTGLGLTLCKRIADIHGFDITVQSSDALTDFIVSSGKNGLLLT